MLVELQISGKFFPRIIGNSHPDAVQVTFQSDSTSDLELVPIQFVKHLDTDSSSASKIPMKKLIRWVSQSVAFQRIV